MNDILKKIDAIRIVPVVKIDDMKDAVPLVGALCEGGLPCVEVISRTDATEEAVRVTAKAYPEMLVGAGTALTTEQVDKAVATGTTSIVGPGLNPRAVKYCVEKGIPVIPGVLNASGIEQVIELDLDVIKFFPAEQMGGSMMIKVLTTPYVKMKLMPTGDVNAKNLNEYLTYNKILAYGGSWMAKPELISAGEPDKIHDVTCEVVQIILGFELDHIGIDTKDAIEAGELTDVFSDIFGFAKKERNSSFFAGTAIGIIEYKGLDDRDHFPIDTNSLPRAISYSESRGIELDSDSTEYDDKGNMTIICSRRDFCGSRIHLIQKE